MYNKLYINTEVLFVLMYNKLYINTNKLYTSLYQMLPIIFVMVQT